MIYTITARSLSKDFYNQLITCFNQVDIEFYDQSYQYLDADVDEIKIYILSAQLTGEEVKNIIDNLDSYEDLQNFETLSIEVEN